MERVKEVTVRYFDVKGQQQTLDCSGLLARVVQHEIDHVNGVLFTDLADPKTFVSQEYYMQHIRVT